jgi:N-acetylmuramoyl-L-alanine amidase
MTATQTENFSGDTRGSFFEEPNRRERFAAQSKSPMPIPFRSAALILASLTAMSVAPARASDSSEPLIFDGSNMIASQTILQPIPASAELPQPATLVDPLAPAADAPVQDETTLAPTPAIAPTGDLSSKVAALRGSDPGSRELECLAVGIYYESKSEPLAGQLAVGHVIANRVHSGRFASSYCGVLFQRSQFSFVRGHSYAPVPRSSRQWQNAVAMAKIVDLKLQDSPVPGALYFHAKRVSPNWHMTRVGSVGNHIFFR